MARTEPTPLELHALAIAAKNAKEVRDRLTVGRGQKVDCLLRIQGAVDVGGDQSACITERPKWPTLLALVLARVPTADRGKLIKAVAKKCETFVADGTEPETDTEAQRAAMQLLAAVGREVIQPRNGNVTGSVSVTVERTAQAA